jgi:hypothetical protein
VTPRAQLLGVPMTEPVAGVYASYKFMNKVYSACDGLASYFQWQTLPSETGQAPLRDIFMTDEGAREPPHTSPRIM